MVRAQRQAAGLNDLPSFHGTVIALARFPAGITRQRYVPMRLRFSEEGSGNLLFGAMLLMMCALSAGTTIAGFFMILVR